MTMPEPTVISMAVKMVHENLGNERKVFAFAVAETFRDAAGDQKLEDWILNKRLGDVMGYEDEVAVFAVVKILFGDKLDFQWALKRELNLDSNEIEITLSDDGYEYIFTKP